MPMKLCMQQKVFSWSDRFSIMDEMGYQRYFVQGELFSWGKRLHITDTTGEEVVYIEQKLFTFLPRYSIFMDGRAVAQVTKEISFLHPVYTVTGPGWEIRGDFFAHEYEFRQGERLAASVYKEWFTWGDCYSIDIENPLDERMALAVAIVIDCVMAQSNN